METFHGISFIFGVIGGATLVGCIWCLVYIAKNEL